MSLDGVTWRELPPLTTVVFPVGLADMHVSLLGAVGAHVFLYCLEGDEVFCCEIDNGFFLPSGVPIMPRFRGRVEADRFCCVDTLFPPFGLEDHALDWRAMQDRVKAVKLIGSIK